MSETKKEAAAPLSVAELLAARQKQNQSQERLIAAPEAISLDVHFPTQNWIFQFLSENPTFDQSLLNKVNEFASNKLNTINDVALLVEQHRNDLTAFLKSSGCTANTVESFFKALTQMKPPSPNEYKQFIDKVDPLNIPGVAVKCLRDPTLMKTRPFTSFDAIESNSLLWFPKWPRLFPTIERLEQIEKDYACQYCNIDTFCYMIFYKKQQEVQLKPCVIYKQAINRPVKSETVIEINDFEPFLETPPKQVTIKVFGASHKYSLVAPNLSETKKRKQPDEHQDDSDSDTTDMESEPEPEEHSIIFETKTLSSSSSSSSSSMNVEAQLLTLRSDMRTAYNYIHSQPVHNQVRAFFNTHQLFIKHPEFRIAYLDSLLFYLCQFIPFQQSLPSNPFACHFDYTKHFSERYIHSVFHLVLPLLPSVLLDVKRVDAFTVSNELFCISSEVVCPMEQDKKHASVEYFYQKDSEESIRVTSLRKVLPVLMIFLRYRTKDTLAVLTYEHFDLVLKMLIQLTDELAELRKTVHEYGQWEIIKRTTFIYCAIVSLAYMIPLKQQTEQAWMTDTMLNKLSSSLIDVSFFSEYFIGAVLRFLVGTGECLPSKYDSHKYVYSSQQILSRIMLINKSGKFVISSHPQYVSFVEDMMEILCSKFRFIYQLRYILSYCVHSDCNEHSQMINIIVRVLKWLLDLIFLRKKEQIDFFVRWDVHGIFLKLLAFTFNEEQTIPTTTYKDILYMFTILLKGSPVLQKSIINNEQFQFLSTISVLQRMYQFDDMYDHVRAAFDQTMFAAAFLNHSNEHIYKHPTSVIESLYCLPATNIPWDNMESFWQSMFLGCTEQTSILYKDILSALTCFSF